MNADNDAGRWWAKPFTTPDRFWLWPLLLARDRLAGRSAQQLLNPKHIGHKLRYWADCQG